MSPSANLADQSGARGVDLSHFNREIDFARMKSAGIQFVYLKASQGAGFADPAFAERREAARGAGLRVGAYHFLDPGVSAAVQSQNFCKRVGSLKSGELPPALDVESTPGWDRLDRPHRILRVSDWLSRTEDALRVRPAIYCSIGWWTENFGEADFSGHPLWLAHYGPEPGPTGLWPRWTIWQFADHSEPAPGSAGMPPEDVDTDVWNGTLP